MIDFSKRAERARELMDDPGCDQALLFNTYRQFRVVNRLFSRWRAIYHRHIRPGLSRGATSRVLDVGCGGGDIARCLVTWAKRDGFDLRVLAIDPDERAMQFVKSRTWPDEISFARASTADVCRTGETFDFVISNHLLHHLGPVDIMNVAHEAERICTRAVLFNDIERSPVAYATFGAFGSLFLHDSFAAPDGRASIRRSFTRDELLALLPPGWNVERIVPYRLLAVCRK